VRLTDNPLEQRLRVAIALGSIGISHPASYTEIAKLTKTASTVQVGQSVLLVSYSEVVAIRYASEAGAWHGPRNSVSKTTQRDIDLFTKGLWGNFSEFNRSDFQTVVKNRLA
jgi:hypothetical protein